MAVFPPDGFYTTEQFFADPVFAAAFPGALNPKKQAQYKGVLIERGRLTIVPHTKKSAPPPPRQQLHEHLVETGEVKPPKPKKPRKKSPSHKKRRVLPPLDEVYGEDIPLLPLGVLWGLSNPELRKYCSKHEVTLHRGIRKEGMLRKIKDAKKFKKL